ncbi:MAG TPA: hypothetical protein VJU61_25890 [Polyangiaceae bacterium]|nr:hypothetical protein [Polyangiaceae bacterium]
MQTCGQELAQSALVPERLAELFQHVAENLQAHAEWVGTESDAARLEHAAMLEVAANYRAIARAATQAARSMRALETLPAAPHDLERWDRAAFNAWMQRKIELQRAFAQLILEHAAASERALQA